MLSHQLTNFEIQKYYQNKTYLKGFYSRNGLPNIVEDGTFVIDLHPNLGGDCVWNLSSGCSKLAVNWNYGNDVTVSRHDAIVNFFFDVV